MENNLYTRELYTVYLQQQNQLGDKNICVAGRPQHLILTQHFVTTVYFEYFKIIKSFILHKVVITYTEQFVKLIMCTYTTVILS